MKDVVYSITPENKLSIDFSFKSPFRVLLTGTSGSGKTTILNLINGSLKPQKGYVNLLSHGKRVQIQYQQLIRHHIFLT
ncbi:TPA: ATP-binding cassette domain-containing protein, partial [Streptococcus pneumoniae]